MRSVKVSSYRVVRVVTHALKTESGTTLWKRLSQHRGQNLWAGVVIEALSFVNLRQMQSNRKPLNSCPIVGERDQRHQKQFVMTNIPMRFESVDICPT